MFHRSWPHPQEQDADMTHDTPCIMPPLPSDTMFEPLVKSSCAVPVTVSTPHVSDGSNDQIEFLFANNLIVCRSRHLNTDSIRVSSTHHLHITFNTTSTYHHHQHTTSSQRKLSFITQQEHQLDILQKWPTESTEERY
jgi:hypothetical protein